LIWKKTKKKHPLKTTPMPQTQLIPDEVTRFQALLKDQGCSENVLAEFQAIVKNHYKVRGRKYPFREPVHYSDPYKVVVSEIMLQQTQADRVVEKYLAFIERFPDFSTLAIATTEDVLKSWIGLGYNRRALALKKIAEIVIEQYQGKVPESIEELEEFPSVGPNTAASIATFAYNIPVPFIETNVRAVYTFFFFHDKESTNDAAILDLVKRSIDNSNPREWYYALMDYGVLLKKTGRDPARKHVAKAKQKAFKGSNRQVRGNILKILLQAPSSIDDLESALGIDKSSIESLVNQLETEGFLVKEGNVFKIK
jgi:A/G-specific adenine glycosylase